MTAAAALRSRACRVQFPPTAARARAPGSSAAADGAPTLLKSGVLQVCTHLSCKPFQFRDDSGKVVGFDVDVMDLVAKELGATQEIVDIDFAQITSAPSSPPRSATPALRRPRSTTSANRPFSSTRTSTPRRRCWSRRTRASPTSPASRARRSASDRHHRGRLPEKNKDANGYEVVVFDDLPTQPPACSPAGRRRNQRQRCRLRLRQDNPTTEVTKGIQHR